MKTTIRFFIGVIFGLLIGFGVGVYTGSHVRDTNAHGSLAALQPPAESPELRTARMRLDELLTVYTPQNPVVKSQQERVRVLEAREPAK